jgi:hypothetical protein
MQRRKDLEAVALSGTSNGTNLEGSWSLGATVIIVKVIFGTFIQKPLADYVGITGLSPRRSWKALVISPLIGQLSSSEMEHI